jgi:hypothetical protein
MGLDDGETHLQRVAEIADAIRRDFAASGREPPDETRLRRAADIVASYPDAWPQYAAPPDDWDGRFAVAILWTWRRARDERSTPYAAAA